MKRLILTVCCIGLLSAPAAASEYLISYVYHTESHDGVPGYGYTVVNCLPSFGRLWRVLRKQMDVESQRQPQSRGKLVSISPISISKLGKQ
jgi:hypothetical protein